jgi:hypothetical protein
MASQKQQLGGYQKTTRQADPNSKEGFSIKARGESEKLSIHKLKKLAIQDGVEIADLVFEALDLVFKVHHFDTLPNPQLQLTPFQQGTLTVDKCKCGKEAFVWALNLQSKGEHKFCKTCFSKLPMRYDQKTWHIIRRKN